MTTSSARPARPTRPTRTTPPTRSTIDLTTCSLPDLVAAARTGRAGAFAEVIRRFDRHVLAATAPFRLPEADRKDAVQTTWLRLFEKLDGVRDPERLGAWLATTAARECLRILRRRDRESLAQEDELDRHVDHRFPLPEQQVVDAVLAARLWEQVDALPTPGRTLLRALTDPQRLPYAEISRRTGMPVGSIGPTRGRYLVRLRGQLERAGLGADTWG
jgi:RNA polymerase sigma factor (sigma-70 family)